MIQLIKKQTRIALFISIVCLLGISSLLFQNCSQQLNSQSEAVFPNDSAILDSEYVTYTLAVAPVFEGETAVINLQFHRSLNQDLDIEISSAFEQTFFSPIKFKLLKGTTEQKVLLPIRNLHRITSNEEITLSVSSISSNLQLKSENTAILTIKPYSQELKMRDVKVGHNHACGLDADSRLRCWGLGINYESVGSVTITHKGMLGNNSTENTIFLEKVSLNEAVLNYDMGSYHTCAVTASQKLFCWGSNVYGQLGLPLSQRESLVPVEPFIEERFLEIKSGYRHTCAMSTDERLFCWGNNQQGQLGLVQSNDPVPKTEIAAYSKNFDLGAFFTCYIDRDKKVHCAGANESGQLGDGTTIAKSLFVTLNLTLVEKIYLGVNTACAQRSDGQSLCWGNNSQGQLGFSNKTIYTTPTNFGSLGSVQHFALGENHSCILSQTSKIACYGQTGDGQTGIKAEIDHLPITAISAELYKIVSAGHRVTCAINKLDQLSCWGQNSTAMIPYNFTNASATPADVQTPVENLLKVAYGSYHGCILSSDSSIYCRGEGKNGQLGQNSTQDFGEFKKVNGLSDLKDFSSGDDHVCAITKENDLWCWGRNSAGQLGIGTMTNSLTPQKVNLPNVRNVQMGSEHTCAQTHENKTFCWGQNSLGQLGLGHNNSVSVPTQVNIPDSYELISGTLTVCALAKVTNDYYCWGSNSGRFGNNTRANSNTPIKLDAIKNFKGLVIGKSQTCGIDSAKEVFCWGTNQFNEIGNASSASDNREYLTPQKVVGISNAKVLAAGYHHTCGGTENGTIFCWGYNKMGQMGNNTIHNQNTAQPIPGLGADLTSLNVGRTNACAIWANKQLRCWGAPRHRLFEPSRPALEPISN